MRDKQSGLARRATPGDVAILFRSRASHREFEAWWPELEQRIDHRTKARRPAHCKAERHAEDSRGTNCHQHALQTVKDVSEQHTAVDQVRRRRDNRCRRRQHLFELLVNPLPERTDQLPDDDEDD